MGMNATITVNDEEIDAYKTGNAYFYLRSKSAQVKKLNISFRVEGGYGTKGCRVQIGYKDGTFKKYYINHYINENGDLVNVKEHVIYDMKNVLVVMVSIVNKYYLGWNGLPGDFKGLLVEELKTSFLTP